MIEAFKNDLDAAASSVDHDAAGQGLIPGLPDHLAMQGVFSKISWWDFGSAIRVSRGWNSAVLQQNSIRPTSSNSPEIPWRTSRFLGCIHPAAPKKPKSSADDPPSFAISIRNLSSIVTDSQQFGQNWETLPPIPGLSYAAPLSSRCIAVDSQIFLLGGRDPQTWEFLSDVFCLDLDQDRRIWRRCCSMQTPRSAFACIASNGKIFVAGGQGEEVLTLASAEVYDPSSDRWEYLPDLNIPRTECNGAVIGDRICIIGGYSSCESSPACELDDEDEPVDTFWVSSADTITVGSRQWETVEDVLSGAPVLPGMWEIRSGILQSVHRSVLRDLLQRSSRGAWKTTDGKIAASAAAASASIGAPVSRGSSSDDGDFCGELMLLAAACGKDQVYACGCSLDSSAPSSPKVRVALCRAVNLGRNGVEWERIECPFELARYGASCFLV